MSKSTKESRVRFNLPKECVETPIKCTDPTQPLTNELNNIAQYFEKAVGQLPDRIVVNIDTWHRVIANNEVRLFVSNESVQFSAAQVSGATYDVFNEAVSGKPFGIGAYGVLRAYPSLKWHICEDVETVTDMVKPKDGSDPIPVTHTVKMIDDGTAVVMTNTGYQALCLQRSGSSTNAPAAMTQVADKDTAQPKKRERKKAKNNSEFSDAQAFSTEPVESGNLQPA